MNETEIDTEGLSLLIGLAHSGSVERVAYVARETLTGMATEPGAPLGIVLAAWYMAAHTSRFIWDHRPTYTATDVLAEITRGIRALTRRGGVARLRVEVQVVTDRAAGLLETERVYLLAKADRGGTILAHEAEKVDRLEAQIDLGLTLLDLLDHAYA